MTLTVDVISDVICPWCFIGKRRLEKAISQFSEPVQVHWQAYQLNPDLPRAGVSRRDYRIKKFGSWERSRELDARVQSVGLEEGIDFAFDLIERTPNTLDAHRLIRLAHQEGVQDTVVEALFIAYFTQGRDISNQTVLLDMVADSGLDRNLCEATLMSQESLYAIRQDAQLARQFQIDSVPSFLLNRRILVVGAQSPDSFLDAFQQARDLT